MKVLVVLTYFRPHISGLTIYAQRLSRGLAARGHQVTVLTSRYDRRLPAEERVFGVRIVRAPVVMRVSKGVIMPTFASMAARALREHDVVSLHLPQFDAAAVAWLARRRGKPTALTYHCDLALPPGPLNRLVGAVVRWTDRVAAACADRVITNTTDFADQSPFLARYRAKVEVIPPPVEMPAPDPGAVAQFRRTYRLDGGGPWIGMAARLATEKGVEVLARALPRILEACPDAKVLFVGPHQGVIGEERYAARLAPIFREYGARWRFLGVLEPPEMAAFFSAVDAIVVPSLNSTESFGLVQVEAMLCGTPSIASALPGVRQPVLQTGMGEIVPVGDSEALADAVLRVVRSASSYVRPRAEIEKTFSTARTVAAYESLFRRLVAE